MRKCKYCNRYYSTYETCPGCGSVQFEEVHNHGALVVSEVPEGGYKIDMSNIKRHGPISTGCKIVGIFLLLQTAFMFFIVLSLAISNPPVEGINTLEDTIMFGFTISSIIPSPFWGIVMYGIGEWIEGTRKNTKKNLERLRKNGILIKNLKYKMINNMIEIQYEIPHGVTIPFRSNELTHVPVHLPDRCDILFDRDNPDIYYIDFDIY